jgi:hypothetical protein
MFRLRAKPDFKAERLRLDFGAAKWRLAGESMIPL